MNAIFLVFTASINVLLIWIHVNAFWCVHLNRTKQRLLPSGPIIECVVRGILYIVFGHISTNIVLRFCSRSQANGLLINVYIIINSIESMFENICNNYQNMEIGLHEKCLRESYFKRDNSLVLSVKCHLIEPNKPIRCHWFAEKHILSLWISKC